MTMYRIKPDYSKKNKHPIWEYILGAIIVFFIILIKYKIY